MKEWRGGAMDKVEQFQNTTIQHGKFNDRLYIMKFPEKGNASLVHEITLKAEQHKYSKIFGKIPGKFLPIFIEYGYEVESIIPKFFKGAEDCYFLSKFLDSRRAHGDPLLMKEFLAVLNNYHLQKRNKLEQDYVIRSLNQDDANEITMIFKEVFTTYPFPVHDSAFIKDSMENDVMYFGVFIQGVLSSISSAEIDFENENAEMTDFAVLNSSRGKGLSKLLLRFMEKEMKKMNIKTLYTIARLKSIPMNKTFLGEGYNYAGTLINNTNISGGIESMNIFYNSI